MTCLGLDVGSSTVKGVKVARREGRFSLLQKETVDLPSASDSQAAQAALRVLIQKLDPREATVVTAVGGAGAVLRSVSMPKMSPQELRTALHFEAEKYIPFKPNEAFLDFVVLGEQPGGRMEVLLAAVRRERVQQHLELLKGAGLVPDVLDLEMAALANAWEVAQPNGSAKTVGLLHIGARGTLLDFIEGKRFRFAREIPVGGQAFTQAIASHLQVDPVQAEKIKRSPGCRLKEVQEALLPVWEEWLDQCRGSFDFYENQFGRGVEQLVVSGGCARGTGFRAWVEAATELPTQEWNPLATLEGPAAASSGVGAQEGIALGVAVGLAVRGCSRS